MSFDENISSMRTINSLIVSYTFSQVSYLCSLHTRLSLMFKCFIVVDLAMTSRDIFTQTDHEVHDVFYYKTRAFNAEVKKIIFTGLFYTFGALDILQLKIL